MRGREFSHEPVHRNNPVRVLLARITTATSGAYLRSSNLLATAVPIVPSQAKPSQTTPNHAKPSHAKPAKQSQAKPSQAKTKRANHSVIGKHADMKATTKGKRGVSATGKKLETLHSQALAPAELYYNTLYLSLALPSRTT